MPTLLDASIADLNAKIQALDSSLTTSPLMQMLKEDAPPTPTAESDDDSIATKPDDESIMTKPDEAPLARSPDDWESEWALLRLAELKLSKQHRGEDASTVLKRDGRQQWAMRNQHMVAWQLGAGWQREQAEAYTCVALGGQTALAQDIREGAEAFVACRALLLAVLAERALLSTEPAPPTYRHLSGLYSLSATDPKWAALCAPDAAPGLSFRTSALAIGTDDASAIDAKGYRVRLSRANSKHFYEAQDSDVVCFRALPTEVSGTPVDADGIPVASSFGSQGPQTHTARSLVQTSALAWHLPPLATVTLAQVVPPGDWSAYGRTVARRLLVVNVAFDC